MIYFFKLSELLKIDNGEIYYDFIKYVYELMKDFNKGCFDKYHNNNLSILFVDLESKDVHQKTIDCDGENATPFEYYIGDEDIKEKVEKELIVYNKCIDFDNYKLKYAEISEICYILKLGNFFKKIYIELKDHNIDNIYIHITCSKNFKKILREGLHEEGVERIGDRETYQKYLKLKNKYLELKNTYL